MGRGGMKSLKWSSCISHPGGEDCVSLPVLMQNILNTHTGMLQSITAFNCVDKIHYNNNVGCSHFS